MEEIDQTLARLTLAKAIKTPSKENSNTEPWYKSVMFNQPCIKALFRPQKRQLIKNKSKKYFDNHTDDSMPRSSYSKDAPAPEKELSITSQKEIIEVSGKSTNLQSEIENSDEISSEGSIVNDGKTNDIPSKSKEKISVGNDTKLKIDVNYKMKSVNRPSSSCYDDNSSSPSTKYSSSSFNSYRTEEDTMSMNNTKEYNFKPPILMDHNNYIDPYYFQAFQNYQYQLYYQQQLLQYQQQQLYLLSQNVPVSSRTRGKQSFQPYQEQKQQKIHGSHHKSYSLPIPSTNNLNKKHNNHQKYSQIDLRRRAEMLKSASTDDYYSIHASSHTRSFQY